MGQGKRNSQLESSYKAAGWSLLCIIVMIIGLTLFGCGTQKEAPVKKEDCCQSK